jgi:hypothetical protein
MVIAQLARCEASQASDRNRLRAGAVAAIGPASNEPRGDAIVTSQGEGKATPTPGLE